MSVACGYEGGRRDWTGARKKILRAIAPRVSGRFRGRRAGSANVQTARTWPVDPDTVASAGPPLVAKLAVPDSYLRQDTWVAEGQGSLNLYMSPGTPSSSGAALGYDLGFACSEPRVLNDDYRRGRAVVV